MRDKNQLIEKIKEDINILNEKIKENYSLLAHSISLITKDEDLFWMDFMFLEKLILELCFNFDFSKYDPIKGFVPQDRLRLFNKIFLPRIKEFKDFHIQFYNQSSIIRSKEHLYYRLFYSIYIQSLTTSKSISDIFHNFLIQWENALKEKKMPIIIEILLPDIFIEHDLIKINENFEIKRYSSYFIEKRYSTDAIGLGPLGSILSYKTEITFNHSPVENIKQTKKIDKLTLIQEWHEKWQPIRELIFSFYLVDINFRFKYHEQILPWWFTEEKKEYKTPDRRLGKIKLSKEKIDELITVHSLVLESEFLKNKQFNIVINRYIRLFNRAYIHDIILDEFIILESIFTQGSTAEVTFRLSLNVALFIAKNVEEFKDIFNFIYEIYGIRSKIIHGGDWTRILKKDKIKKIFSSDNPRKISQELYKKLKHYIDLSLKKIINLIIRLKKENKTLNIKDFKRTYFLEHCEFVNAPLKKENL